MASTDADAVRRVAASIAWLDQREAALIDDFLAGKVEDWAAASSDLRARRHFLREVLDRLIANPAGPASGGGQARPAKSSRCKSSPPEPWTPAPGA